MIVPFTLEIALEITSIPRKIVVDLPDRMIAATASFLNLPLVTRDRSIQSASTVKTIWYFLEYGPRYSQGLPLPAPPPQTHAPTAPVVEKAR